MGPRPVEGQKGLSQARTKFFVDGDDLDETTHHAGPAEVGAEQFGQFVDVAVAKIHPDGVHPGAVVVLEGGEGAPGQETSARIVEALAEVGGPLECGFAEVAGEALVGGAGQEDVDGGFPEGDVHRGFGAGVEELHARRGQATAHEIGGTTAGVVDVATTASGVYQSEEHGFVGGAGFGEAGEGGFFGGDVVAFAGKIGEEPSGGDGLGGVVGLIGQGHGGVAGFGAATEDSEETSLGQGIAHHVQHRLYQAGAGGDVVGLLAQPFGSVDVVDGANGLLQGGEGTLGVTVFEAQTGPTDDRLFTLADRLKLGFGGDEDGIDDVSEAGGFGGAEGLFADGVAVSAGGGGVGEGQQLGTEALVVRDPEPVFDGAATETEAIFTSGGAVDDDGVAQFGSDAVGGAAGPMGSVVVAGGVGSVGAPEELGGAGVGPGKEGVENLGFDGLETSAFVVTNGVVEDRVVDRHTQGVEEGDAGVLVEVGAGGQAGLDVHQGGIAPVEGRQGEVRDASGGVGLGASRRDVGECCEGSKGAGIPMTHQGQGGQDGRDVSDLFGGAGGDVGRGLGGEAHGQDPVVDTKNGGGGGEGFMVPKAGGATETSPVFGVASLKAVEAFDVDVGGLNTCQAPAAEEAGHGPRCQEGLGVGGDEGVDGKEVVGEGEGEGITVGDGGGEQGAKALFAFGTVEGAKEGDGFATS